MTLSVVNGVPPADIITPYHPRSIGGCVAGASLNWGSGGAWPSANLALFVPFVVEGLALAQKMLTWVSSASGNVDLGIYDAAGNRLVSIGSTAASGTSIQEYNITDLLLARGQYYMALAADNGTIQIRRGGGDARPTGTFGMAEMASAFPLPSTATVAKVSNAYVPAFGVAMRTVAA